MNRFQKLLASISRSTTLEVIHSSGDSLPTLLTDATALFDHHGFQVQVTALAIMLGMILATLEGETCEGESQMGVIITSKERLAIFMAEYKVVFNEALAARRHPDFPESRNKQSIN